MLAADTLPPEIEQRLKRCKTLPTLPGVAVKIIDLGEDPDVSMKAVSDVVSLDPALSARILSIANSPLYAQRRSVENLNQALMLLGLNATMSLALSFSLVKGLRDGPDQHELDYDRIWRRTMIAATAARLLSDLVPEYSGEDLFLGGLLQDVGILALDQVLSEKAYGKVLNKTDHEGLPAAEQKKFGVNHVQVGNWLLTRWRLPEFLRNAVGASHAVSCDEAPESAQKAMALASRMADAMVGDADGEALVRLMDTAQALFDMDGERVAELLDELSGLLPDLESLFEVSMPDASERESVTEQAREMLLLHNLRAQQVVTEIQAESERLQDHARRLEEQVRRDSLTGVFNRSYIDDQLKTRFHEASDSRTSLAVLFIDVDHFKSVNDTWGHAVGDQVLIGVAERLDEVLRRGHLLGRYGGEEFVVVLPGVDAEGAVAIAEHARELLKKTPVATVSGEDIHVTFSGGVAVHDAQNAFSSHGELVRAADHAMYSAKVSGRDHTRLHEAQAAMSA